PAALGLADALFALGGSDDALLVLQRWSASVGATPSSVGDSAAQGRARSLFLAAASLAAAGGRLPTAIRMAQKAIDVSAQDDSSAGWGISPWLYPAALDSLYGAIP